MRALTLKPHWAHAVTHLGKRCENRSRPIPPALLGQRIAIHAGAALPKGWALELEQASRHRFHGWGGVCSGLGWIQPRRTAGPTLPVVTRAIVATAVLVECEKPHGFGAGNTLRWHATWNDPDAAWWWHLDDVWAPPVPVRCPRGQLGLWRLPASLGQHLEALRNGTGRT
jgi:hypothetical protein